MSTKTTIPRPARKPRADAKGLKQVGVRLRPDQDDALTKMAKVRADKAGRTIPDKSEIVREALDAWFGKARAK